MPRGITQLALAQKMGVPIQRVNGVVAGRRAVSAETAILLARALRTTPERWLRLQVAVDLWEARQRLAGVAVKRRGSRRSMRPAKSEGATP